MPKQANNQNKNKQSDRAAVKTPRQDNFLIVGLGASAGGIQALREFFKQVPADSGIAYVVILHLSPDHDSYLSEVLQQVALIPVTQVTQKTQVAPNHIYVISPSNHLLMQDGFVATSPNMTLEDRRAPVDIFLRTLADSHATNAVCVILSGTGANGSMGLKRIKENGGVVFVQNPNEAEFDEMPHNAIATELADEVLPVAELPQKIIAYRDRHQSIDLVVRIEEEGDTYQRSLREIFLQLRTHTGHDFTNYKRPTLLRRIERRINVRNMVSLPDYAALLKENPEEVNALLKDLLISVTNFFRDQKAFTALEQTVIPRILLDKTSKDQVRIWVAGCATGEEAYSLAMLFAEKTMDILNAPKIQIFATDIDEDAIAHARAGLYTINDAADVSPEQLRRFFTEESGLYRVRREIREMVLFADHNVIKDPPFSHLDLISCRNLMIYLNQIAQERVISTFHFALKPGSFLFLGTSESIDSAGDLFTQVSREHHIYQSRQVGTRLYPLPDANAAFPAQQPSAVVITQPPEKKILDRITFNELHQRLLEAYAPPSLIVNEEYDIVHLSGTVGNYLHLSGGAPSQNLLQLVREELRLELRTALYQAVQRQMPVETRGIKIQQNDRNETIRLHVRPVLQHDTARGFLLVLFEPFPASEELEEVVLTSDQPISHQLEEELMRIKAQLRSTSEQHEFQAEELKASNEELQAMNEELRSATEELETSKEELQSMNEELRTVNQELKVKIDETTVSTNNLMNLINSADVATIFLDRSLQINLFTPVARRIFNLISSDFGRPLTDITNKLAYTGVLEDAKTVLQNLQPFEKEVQTTSDQTYLMRIMPYRTSDDHINGVVLSFFDITERKVAEQQSWEAEEKYRRQLEQKVEERTVELNKSREHYASLIENTPDAITRWSKDLTLIFANSAFAGKTGMHLEQLYGKTNLEMEQPDAVAVPYMDSLRKAFETGGPVEHFDPPPTPDREVQFYSRIVPEKNEKGEVETVIAIARDITDLKKAEHEILRLKDEIARQTEEKYRILFESVDEGLAFCELVRDTAGQVTDFRFLEVNPAFEHHSSLQNGSVTGRLRSEVLPIMDPTLDMYEQVVRTGEPVRFEMYAPSVDRWFNIHVLSFGRNDQFANLFTDITQRKRQEQHQVLLADISKELVGLTSIEETAERLTEKIGRYFGTAGCVFAGIMDNFENTVFSYGWNNEAVPSLNGTYKLHDFISSWQLAANNAGELSIVTDTQTDPRIDANNYQGLGIRSFMVVPLSIGGHWKFQLAVIHNEPRQWREDEVKLLQEITSHVWIRLERAKSEEKLRESEARFRTLADAVPQVIWSNDAKGKANYFNERWYEYSGLSYEASVGLGWEAIVHPDDAPASGEKWHNALAAGAIFDTEYRLRRKDNTYRWHIGRNIPLKDGTGYVLGWFGSATDIEDMKQAEAAAGSATQRLQLALEAGKLGTYEYDFSTDTIFATSRHKTDFGFPDDGTYNFKALRDRILPQDRAVMDKELQEAVDADGVYVTEYRIQLPAGDIRWIRSVGRIIYNDRKEPLKMAGITLDITEQKLFTEELSRQVAERTMELQRSNEDLRQFAHVASHDLKEPVRKIKTFNSRLLDEFADQMPPVAKTYLAKIGTATDRMVSMIDGVLRYSKLSDTDKSFEPVDLNRIIQLLKTDLEVLMQEKEAELTTVDLPVIQGDAVLIYQLFYNLVLNALKFAKSGIASRIDISCERVKVDGRDFFQIVVADNGIGFEPEFEQVIFKTFARLHTVDEYAGTGLGLALCKKIMERHDGSISAAGRPGYGAAFTLLLPFVN